MRQELSVVYINEILTLSKKHITINNSMLGNFTSVKLWTVDTIYVYISSKPRETISITY